MNNLANKTTFWSFLSQTRIRIPRIQRDYAQGRKGKENLREEFLTSLSEALNGKTEQLKLDFIYGSGDGDGHFSPLDGQQRLTTLWLLHWYFAYRLYKGNKLGDENAIKIVKEILIRFSYETRESSRAFIQRLVNEGLSIKQRDDENIAEAIMRQSWMFTSWRQDPTVQSMLRMLSGEENEKVDGIEELYGKTADDKILEYWELLKKDTSSCPIIFYQLDIDNLGQSDDLYVKMNGRGKPLTDFENFKADLIKYIEEQKWNDLLDAIEGYPILMDTKWTDFIWDYRKEEIPFDDIYFGFINRFFLAVLMRYVPDLESSLLDSDRQRVYDYLYSFIEAKTNRALYTEVGFGIYQDYFKLIQKNNQDVKSVLETLLTVLNNLCASRVSIKQGSLLNSPYYKDKCFTPVYVQSIASPDTDLYSLTQPQFVAFWAMCYFFSKTSDTTNLQKWMRIVWNTCDYNEEIRSKQAIISCIRNLALCVPNPGEPYQSLTNLNSQNPSFKSVDWDTAVGQHISEEIEKVTKIKEGKYNGTLASFAGKTWEEVIGSVEKHEYLCGTIRCLLLNQDGAYEWRQFDNKYEHLLEYKDLGYIAARNYLIYDFDRIYNDYWYPGNELANKKHWRTILSDTTRSKIIHDWLIASPLDNTQLKRHCKAANKGYEYSMIVGSTLLSDAPDKRGLYLAYSGGTCGGKYVLFHHQTSRTYVVLYEYRNRILNELLGRGLIQLSDSNNWLACNAYNGKDVVFDYNGDKYRWSADGSLKREESDPDSWISFDENNITDANQFMNFLGTIQVVNKPKV